LPDGTQPEHFNLWRVPRIDEGWGSPEQLPDPISTDHEEFYPSLTTSGDLYFTSDRPGGLGGEDVWWAQWTGEGWGEPANLGPAVNSPGPEFNSLIAPDGSIFFFTSSRVPEGTPEPASLAELNEVMTGPGNGRDNIWWVDVALIEGLRP